MLVTGILLIAGGSLYAWSRSNQKNALQIPFTQKHFSLTDSTPQKNDEAERLQETDIVDIEQWADHYFNVSSAALGVAAIGIWVPVFQIPAAVGLTYLTIPIWQQTYKDLIKRKRLTTGALESIALPAFALSGYMFVAVASNWLYYLGSKFIAKSKNYSSNQLKTQLTQPLKSVWLKQDGYEVTYEDIQLGDVVVIQAGETIPVDGVIIEGVASIDERMMTGESQLAEKIKNEQVFAFTIVLAGKVWVKVEKTGQETIAAQIEQALEQTNHYAATIELRIKEIIDNATIPTLILTLITLPTVGLTSALIVLDSPIIDSIMITGPLGILIHLSIASKQNILIKDGRILEILKRVDTIVFDKTGTLTHSQPHVGKIYPLVDTYTEQEILTYAAIAESKQTHPIAKAIRQAAEQYHLELDSVTNMQYELGYGIKVLLGDKTILVGSTRFMQLEHVSISQHAKDLEQKCYRQGYSLVYVAINQNLAGLIELHPTIRPEAAQVIQSLKQRGLSLYIISGDHHNPTKALAEKLGIDHYFAETLPEDKANLIKQLQADGKSVCFIGDGMNDAIALKTANVSVSLQGASNIATDTAQVILMDENLTQLPQMFNIADSLNRNVKNSLVLDVVPNTICIGGALFFHLSIYGALAIYSIGLLGNLANGVAPLLSKRNQTIQHQPTSIE
ncbi:heavy metal translocating P-type ATPase [Candidatus Albibeggiatoa sp. nov. BB20]|uniref:heavy metal translocating P-type ATPase n=1 Tax=Candidatus Albibeggiatoa sp. nov. BB20 TaxID=3162723 RepID=UPI0033654ABC